MLLTRLGVGIWRAEFGMWELLEIHGLDAVTCYKLALVLSSPPAYVASLRGCACWERGEGTKAPGSSAWGVGSSEPAQGAMPLLWASNGRRLGAV